MRKVDNDAISECACVSDVTVCPASGMYARMWAPLEPECPSLKPNASQRHETQTGGEFNFPVDDWHADCLRRSEVKTAPHSANGSLVAIDSVGRSSKREVECCGS